ncbi:hypothetical protein Q2T94_12770 [Paeniglutamicibacter sulfureus]|uniref:hypothetical protein n=1 Tax=Paeniglutamicibacter sulfureus TaxID=43666 RepID=UPI00266677AA|nr:hypothetical protein [Paeniglutamicibacter sulfureus]MDO2935180.1 hypothetical protein [Paeniglutamicibacter sulfureus]
MANPTRFFRGLRFPLARAATIALAAMILLLGLGAPGAQAHTGLPGNPTAQGITGTTTPQETAGQFHAAPSVPDNAGKTPGKGTDGTGAGTEEEHRFLSPGLLGLAGLVAATALVGTYLTIRSRHRPPHSQETE